MKKLKYIIPTFIILLLICIFTFNINVEDTKSEVVSTEAATEETISEFEEIINQTEAPVVVSETPIPTEQASAIATTQQPNQMPIGTKTQPTPSAKPTALQVESNEEVKKNTCFLSVRCDTAIANINKVKKEKQEILPKDGIIFAEREVEFNDGESAFDVLLREMKNNKIHLEFDGTAVNKTAYVEGIGNLYEFDVGDMSGWMYRVNGVFASVGCSEREVKAGDKIEFIYSCNFGKDIE